MQMDDILAVIDENGFNVTFSGGDPFFQADTVALLAKRIHSELGKTIWCYTGYLWGQVTQIPHFAPLLANIDVLVDGRFEMAKRDTSLRFRGSANQRIILVPQSLQACQPILWAPQ